MEEKKEFCFDIFQLISGIGWEHLITVESSEPLNEITKNELLDKLSKICMEENFYFTKKEESIISSVEHGPVKISVRRL